MLGKRKRRIGEMKMRVDELTLKREWAEWWSNYPHKVAKIAAEKAYRSARVKRKASAQDLLTGLASYIQHKPEWQSWANGASWLNSGRWMDDYSRSAPSRPPVKQLPAAYRPYIPLGDRDRMNRDTGN
jgi:hypothetical protein